MIFQLKILKSILSSNMVNRKILSLVLFLSAVQLLQAQWKNEITSYLADKKDYKGAIEYLTGHLNQMDDTDKPDAYGLLAFSYANLNDQASEMNWLVQYFESSRGKESSFAFLDLMTQAEVIEYLARWKSKYPLITEIAFISTQADNIFLTQGILPLDIEISNDAYYKFSNEKEVIKAGLFKAGFNLIGLDIIPVLEKSGTYTYFLEVKNGNLILKREIDLEADVHSPFLVPKASPAIPKINPMEYKLSMYVNGQLILTSQKIEKSVALKLDMHPSKNPFGFKPDYWVTRNNPGQNYVSILDAIGVAYQLLKDLLKKKKSGGTESSKIKKLQEISIAYKRKDTDGVEKEIRAQIKLKTKNISYLLMESEERK